MLIFNLISNNTVCNTNTTTNANEIKALTRIESEKYSVQACAAETAFLGWLRFLLLDFPAPMLAPASTVDYKKTINTKFYDVNTCVCRLITFVAYEVCHIVRFVAY